MPITDWPKDDRPREKLLHLGEKYLTDAELIAIFINNGVRGQTALDIAKELLKEFGNIKQLLSAPKKSLLQKCGIGNAKYAALKAALELGRRYLTVNIDLGEALNSSHKTKQFLSDRLRENKNEVFACLFMDNHFRFLSFEELSQGTINETHIYPREIIKRALTHNAAKVILAHNHPSGLASPSAMDKETTQIIQQGLGFIDVDVIDHIIIGEDDYFSFADHGWL